MATKAAERQPLRMAFLPSALTCAYINEEVPSLALEVPLKPHVSSMLQRLCCEQSV